MASTAPADLESTEVAPRKLSRKQRKQQERELDYEWEFDTPFAKLEFEVEPRDTHEEKERKRREKAERDAANKAAKLAKQAAKEAEKRGITGPVVIVKRNNLFTALVIFTIIVAAIGIAFWLFGRPDEDDDAIPAELRKDAVAAAPDDDDAGIFGRLKKAVRAGRRASRDAQDEQQRRFEEATNQG
jgi:hypothetical protein